MATDDDKKVETNDEPVNYADLSKEELVAMAQRHDQQSSVYREMFSKQLTTAYASSPEFVRTQLKEEDLLKDPAQGFAQLQQANTLYNTIAEAVRKEQPPKNDPTSASPSANSAPGMKPIETFNQAVAFAFPNLKR